MIVKRDHTSHVLVPDRNPSWKRMLKKLSMGLKRKIQRMTKQSLHPWWNANLMWWTLTTACSSATPSPCCRVAMLQWVLPYASSVWGIILRMKHLFLRPDLNWVKTTSTGEWKGNASPFLCTKENCLPCTYKLEIMWLPLSVGATMWIIARGAGILIPEREREKKKKSLAGKDCVFRLRSYRPLRSYVSCRSINN